MRKACFLALFLSLAICSYAQEVPQASGWVNDFAGVISPAYKEKINALIEETEQKTSSEIAVVTIDSISPYSEIDYARLLFDKWKPGKKGKDNGVLVVLAVRERRWRIETGYGVEGILPDGLCGEIGRRFMVPYFKEGDYSQGLYQGVAKIAQIISGKSPEEKTSPDPDLSGLVLLAILLIFFGLPFIFYKRHAYRDGSTYYGGGFGGFGSGGFGSGGFGGFGGGRGGGGGAGGGF